MVIDDGGTLRADAHRREPDVVGRQATGLDGVQGVFEPPETGIHVVGAKGEFDAARLGGPDDVKGRNAVARVDFQGDVVFFQHVQDAVHALRRPEGVVFGLQDARQEGRVGIDIGRLIGQDQYGLVHEVVHVLLLGDAVEMNLLGAVDAGVAALVVDDGHRVREEVFENAQGVLGEGLRPFAAFALHAEEEGLAADLVVVGMDFGVVREHATHAALAGIRCHAVVDAIIHGHCVGHLLGQVALEVDVVVDDGEVRLLEADDAVRLLVDGRKGVGGILQALGQGSEGQVAEFDRSLDAPETDAAGGDALLLMPRGAPGLIRFGVADDVHAVDSYPDVLAAHCDIEVEPFAVLRKGAIEVSYVQEAAGLDAAVYGAVVEEDAVAAAVFGHTQTDQRLGALGGASLAIEFEVLAGFFRSPAVAFIQRELGWDLRAGREGQDQQGEESFHRLSFRLVAFHKLTHFSAIFVKFADSYEKVRLIRALRRLRHARDALRGATGQKTGRGRTGFPGGRFAQRPIMYVDGDESYTKTGIEYVIGNEVSMKREKDYDFYSKFDAIDRFVKNNSVITDGEAHIIRQDDDGFVVWQIQKEGLKNSILVVANYQSPTEKFLEEENGNSWTEIREGKEVFDKTIELSCDYSIVSEFRFDGVDYIEEKFVQATSSLTFGKLMPSEFKFFTVVK